VRYYLYAVLISGLLMEGNPGALRAIKDAAKWKEDIENLKRL
tara:strand:+ start:83 stop:208 length:126 start_codon:yes stop_codon:yes gene_type:complete